MIFGFGDCDIWEHDVQAAAMPVIQTGSKLRFILIEAIIYRTKHYTEEIRSMHREPQRHFSVSLCAFSVNLCVYAFICFIQRILNGHIGI